MADKLWMALSNEIAGMVAEAGKSIVAVAGCRHPSSGVLIAADALITASHAVRRDDDIAVIAGPGQKIAARVAGRDPETDLALLRLEQPINAPIAKWSNTQNLRVGELAIAIGRTWRGNIVASAGILSGVIAGPWRTWRGGELDQFIRPDLTLYPGFSGGPLLASDGGFLGINTAGLHRTGITVPAAAVERVGKELLDKGRLERAYLGLGMHPVALPESLRSRLNLTSGEGLLIVHVEQGGPADKAGVMLGDILLEFAGRAVADTDTVQSLLRKAKVGEKVQAGLIRAGALNSLTVALEARAAH